MSDFPWNLVKSFIASYLCMEKCQECLESFLFARVHVVRETGIELPGPCRCCSDIQLSVVGSQNSPASGTLNLQGPCEVNPPLYRILQFFVAAVSRRD